MISDSFEFSPTHIAIIFACIDIIIGVGTRGAKGAMAPPDFTCYELVYYLHTNLLLSDTINS